MIEAFDKNILFNNITYILKKEGKRIGELESEVGVSTGYISRTSKDDNTKPGIDFVVNTAQALGVSVDSLISIDMAALTPTEKYLLDFIEKLTRDSLEDKLEWRKDTALYLNNLKSDDYGEINHPLFERAAPLYPGIIERPVDYDQTVFCSNTFEYRTTISDDCFRLSMKNDVELFLMSIRKSPFDINDYVTKAKEIWMHGPGAGATFISSNIDEKLSLVVERLFNIVQERNKHPQIDKSLKYSIDAFMRDDLEDDDMPF